MSVRCSHSALTGLPWLRVLSRGSYNWGAFVFALMPISEGMHARELEQCCLLGPWLGDITSREGKI